MVPTAELFDEISRRREGSLEEVRFPLLLQALSVCERTAVLEIRRGPIRKRIVVEYGTPVDCQSNLVHETLGRVMVARGKLTEEQQDEYVRRALANGVPLGEVLRDEGVVEPLELYKILQQNLAKKLLDGFTWKDGSFELGFDVPEVSSPLKVRVPQLVLTGITRFTPVEEVNAAVVPLIGKRLGVPPDPTVDPGELKLSDGQRAIVESLRSPRRLDELAVGGPLSHGEVSRLIYALSVLGILVTEEELKGRSGRAPAAPAAASAAGRAAGGAGAGEAEPRSRPTVEPELPAAEAGKLKNEVMEAYLAHRRQDAFDLLGVTEEASVADVRQRFLRFARHYAPWRFQSAELKSVAEKAEDLFVAGARAFGELMDTEQRNTLIFRRKSLEEERAKEGKKAPADFFRIDTDLLDSERQFKKGLKLMQAGRYEKAAPTLEFAADCDPQNTLYRAEAAYCRYLADPRMNGRQALEQLEEALRIDPRAGLAAYYAGEIHRARGEWDEAEAHLRRANQLLAPDRRPIEALKALAKERK